jgi:pimeloyl-ACP methyl ester carboxylesterase
VDTAAGVCNDLPWDQAYENALNFAHQSGASFLEGVTQLAYKDIPASYIFCENDLIVAPELQTKFIKNIADATGKEVEVVRLSCGHCPNWSIPEKVAEVVGDLATKSA